MDCELIATDIAAAIRRIWASSCMEVSLRALQDVGARDLSVAVVLQRLPAVAATLQVLTARPDVLPKLKRQQTLRPCRPTGAG